MEIGPCCFFLAPVDSLPLDCDALLDSAELCPAEELRRGGIVEDGVGQTCLEARDRIGRW